MTGLKAVDVLCDPSELESNQGKSLFRSISVEWEAPEPIVKGHPIKFDKEEYSDQGYLYIVTRNHGNMIESDRICYVGITERISTRFYGHKTVKDLRDMGGDTALSIGIIDFGQCRLGKGKKYRRALEELEHIFIWSVNEQLWNKNKQFTLPGMGKNPGQAWDIENKGYKFSGRMPSRIVYPWIAARPRPNKTGKV